MMTKKAAQALVNRLSEEWGVPPIKIVRVPKNIRAPGVGVYFSDAPDWHIGITNHATEEKIQHEFFHYIEALIKTTVPNLEEKVVKSLTASSLQRTP